MSEKPFFSIVIPTKNRSSIIGNAIESVLKQSYGDFELIISDNDDDESKTKNVVYSYIDKRIRYFRTNGKLSMPDNWEFAISQVKGRYATVLEDKQIFYPRALEFLYNLLVDKNSSIAVWINDRFDDTVEPTEYIKYKGTNKIYIKKADEILKKASFKRIYYREIPRMINSVVSTDFIEFIRNSTELGRFFNAVNPDFVAGFIQLNYFDEIIYIDKAINITGGKKISNGLSNYKKGDTAKRFIKNIGENYFYNHVPIKAVMTNNSIINDFYRIKTKLKGNLTKHDISSEVYMVMCYEDILISENLGTNMVKEKTLWDKELKRLDTHMRKKVRKEAIKMKCSVLLYDLLDNIPYVKQYTNNKKNNNYQILTGYVNAFEAAGYSE